ncbi:MAG TPA: NUDIX domain-containing protein [Candidatus Kapabacteria bacterium]|jgi:8-oxo-dGTP pyrophosphatase MutT (NUDIX family)|nr:NUDIX domain-containing protein [Candidatus Kapabacteria bacterium]
MALRIRRTARVILLNDWNEILMIQHSDNVPANPKEPDRLTYWVAPGGGVEDGETYEEAAIRELKEETGVDVEGLERCILERDIDLVYSGELVTSRECFFLVRIVGRPLPIRFKIEPAENISDFQWWSLSEIEKSNETFFPEGLVDLIRVTNKV